MILLWIILLMIFMWVKEDLEKNIEEQKKENELQNRIRKAEKKREMKRYMLSILSYRTIKPGPSNYPCQYLEWASGVKFSKYFTFYGKPVGVDDELIPTEEVKIDLPTNLATICGISDKEATTFSALVIDFNNDGILDLIVARSNGVWLYKNMNKYPVSQNPLDLHFEKIQLYAPDKISEPYALALAEFGSEEGELGHPIRVHLSRCINPRWIKPILLNGYQPHHTVANKVDHSTGEILEEDVLVETKKQNGGSNDRGKDDRGKDGGESNNQMSTALVDLTSGFAEPFYSFNNDKTIIGSSADEFNVDPSKLDFNVRGYENFFDLYKDQILARTDRTVKYFMLREDGRVFIPDFKNQIVPANDNRENNSSRNGRNDLFWIELIKNNHKRNNNLLVGLPNEEEMNGAEVFYGSQNQRLSDPKEIAEFSEEKEIKDNELKNNGLKDNGLKNNTEKGKVLGVVTRSGLKYQLLNPRMNCQYQLCPLFEMKDSINNL